MTTGYGWRQVSQPPICLDLVLRFINTVTRFSREHPASIQKVRSTKWENDWAAMVSIPEYVTVFANRGTWAAEAHHVVALRRPGRDEPEAVPRYPAAVVSRVWGWAR